MVALTHWVCFLYGGTDTCGMLTCKVHWRVGRTLGSSGLILVQPLIGLTITAFSIGSVLSVGIGCSVLSIHTDHSTLWWMVVGVHRLMLFQECRREVF